MYSGSLGVPRVGIGVATGGSTLAMTGAPPTALLVVVGLVLVLLGAGLLRLAHFRRKPLP